MTDLGFGPAPWPVWVYCNRTNGGLWYTVKDGDPEVIPHEALTGFPVSLSFPRVERRGKEVIKMNLTLKADRIYILESGHDSQFSKSLMTALSVFPPGSLTETAITIVPSPGDDESVLFCGLFVDGEQVRVEQQDPNPDLRKIAAAAMAAVGGSTNAKN